MRNSSSGICISFYCLVISAFLIITTMADRVILTFSDDAVFRQRHQIIIDPGHGGEDGGAVSCTNKCESSYNLSISLRMRDLLCLLGCRTVMTRDTDKSIYTGGNTALQRKASDLKERVKIANASPGNILVSIHQNYFQEAKYSGAQVFCASGEKSALLAQMLQGELIHSLNRDNNRKEKRGEGIYLLEKAHYPAVLVECGFISNPQEEAQLRDDHYQKKLACVIAAVTTAFIPNA